MKKKQEYSIELIEEYENLNFYSIRLKGAELTELEAFFEKFPEGSEYDEDIDVIISWIDQIAERNHLEKTYMDTVYEIIPKLGNKSFVANNNKLYLHNKI